uniref:Cytochrome P450 n=2 Tax=Clastoptera arizonana TaxID=38151 RepID=A0A1B6CUW2_9HEMI
MIFYSSLSRCSRYLSYYINKDIPGPKGIPILGTTLDLISAGSGPKLHHYIDKRHKQFGPIFKESLGPVNAVFISNPYDIRRVYSVEGKYPVHLLPDSWILYNKLYEKDRGLFFMKGEEWLHYRQIMNKLMLKNELSPSIFQTYEFVVKSLIDDWRKEVGKEIKELNKQLYKLSISFVVAHLIGSSYPLHKEKFEPHIENLSTTAQAIFKESSKLSLIPPKFAYFLRLPMWKRFVSSVHSSIDTATKMVKEMLALTEKDGLLYKMSSESIPFDKMVSIVVDLIIAAVDTTPHTMGWSLYLLSQDKLLQTKIAKVIQSAENEVEILNDPLLRSVHREALRLYPAAPFITRALPADTNIGGYLVSQGQMIIISMYTAGRNEEYFPNSMKFWPERWIRSDNGNYLAVNDPNASLPFAIGARSCIGRKLAEAQMILSISKIVSNFQFNIEEEVDMILHLVPVPDRPIRLRITSRT